MVMAEMNVEFPVKEEITQVGGRVPCLIRNRLPVPAVNHNQREVLRAQWSRTLEM
jgi:hypothetical protein